MSDLSTLLVIDADNNALDRVAFGFEREGMLVARTAKPEDAGGIVRESRPQVIIAGLPGDANAGLDLLKRLKADGASGVPLLLLGSPGGAGVARDAALKAGAAEFLARPAYIRDIVTAARIVAGTRADVFRGNLREIGVFPLLRAMDATFRSGALALERPGAGGARRAMIQWSDGEPVVASIGDVTGLPALQRLLLWNEGTIELRFQSILRPGKPLADSRVQVVAEVLDFMKAIGDLLQGLGQSEDLYTQDPKRVAEAVNQIPKEVAPVIRLFDGKRTLCDVTDESPFRPRDTLRVANKLRGMGILRRDDKQKKRHGSGSEPAVHAAPASARANPVPPPQPQPAPAPTAAVAPQTQPAHPPAPPPPPPQTQQTQQTQQTPPPKPSANPWVALAGGKPSVNPSYAAVTAPGLELRGEIKSSRSSAPPPTPAESVVTEPQDSAAAAPPPAAAVIPETRSSPKIQLPETKSSPKITTGSQKKAARLPSQSSIDEGALERGLEAALDKPKRTTGQQAALPGVAPFEAKREGLEAVLNAAQRGQIFAEGARPVAPDEANHDAIEAKLAAVSRAISGHDDERTIPVERLTAEELGLAATVTAPVAPAPAALAPAAAMPAAAPAAPAQAPVAVMSAPAPVAAPPAAVVAPPALVTAPVAPVVEPAAAAAAAPAAPLHPPVAHPHPHAVPPPPPAAAVAAPPPAPSLTSPPVVAKHPTPIATGAAARLPGVTPSSPDLSRHSMPKPTERPVAPPAMRHGSEAKATKTPARGVPKLSPTPGKGMPKMGGRMTPGLGVGKFSDMEEDFFAGASKLAEEQPTESFDDLEPVSAEAEAGGWRGLFGLFGKKKPPPQPTRRPQASQPSRAAAPAQGSGSGKPAQPAGASKPGQAPGKPGQAASAKSGTGPKKKR